ncbi:GyrI-like domain-containing protein [Halobacillus sp. GSS1]|uniref:GyrI-like domain-containing protein n=1 Tax=Halobacillus sp. GSS1 TaxID=2815919 RepID=UPI001A8C2089|nr:GyrI-like domain-containing protein [Halobacillus sp. GSS1]MBN9653467.1 GyrI-like domain-containing protein [Halobacillus sp. GSS1]
MKKNNRVEEKEAFTLIGYRVVCDGEDYIMEIPKAAEKLHHRFPEADVQIGAFIPGECKEENDGYWIGVPQSPETAVPDDMESLLIEKQTYAITTYEGSNDRIREAYESLHHWMEWKGYPLELTAWHVEVYHSWQDKEELHMELWETVRT